MDRKWFAIAVAFLLLITLPYVLGFILQGTDSIFGGFLLNPIDGNSYLAKMQEGWNGSWTFQLPYTLDPGRGNFLFLFYLFLGHLGRWLGLPLLLVFHAVRVLSALLLAGALLIFARRIFHQNETGRKAFTLALFGSGLGWLMFFSGKLTSDFWVAEAYPLLSAYANPHFPLGLSLLLFCFVLTLQSVDWKRGALLAILALLLAVIQPFGVVLGCVVLAGRTAWEWFETRQFHWRSLSAFGFGGIPLVFYQYWATLRDPDLVVWNSQNLTPAPPGWDFLLALSPAFLLGLVAIFKTYRSTDSALKLLIVWMLGGTLLTYLPFNLQRRFMTGIYIPAAFLAVMGLLYLVSRFPKLKPGFAWRTVFITSILTNILVLLAGTAGMVGRDASIYLSRGEGQAFEWIRENTDPGARILCSPETGLFIPAYTGRRVLYGHPFETILADEHKAVAASFFREPTSADQQNEVIGQYAMDYLFVGPRELQISGDQDFGRFRRVYQADGVTIYQTRQQP